MFQETRRLARITQILTKHGLYHALFGERHYPPPKNVKEAFEELGVVFLKFGQVLALRRDLLPLEYIRELESLHDRLPPMSAADVESVISRAFGKGSSDVFAEFDPTPIAAATIAQVHMARLHDNRSVVVKVRRPDLDALVSEDIAALSYLAALAENLSSRLRVLDLIGIVREFNVNLRREMDLRAEARTIRRFRAVFADFQEVWIPDAVEEYTTDSVLTMEHSPGERLDTYTSSHPETAAALARTLGRFMLRGVFAEGLFHADPHPGNVFALPDGRLCLHDFGMVGELDEKTRSGLTRLLEATVRGDVRELTTAYLDLVVTGDNLERSGLESDIAALLRRVREKPPGEVSVGDSLETLVRLGTRHGVRNSGVFLPLTRAFLITESVMRQLDPSVDFIEIARTEMPAIMQHRYSPERAVEAGRKLVREIEHFVQEAPGDAYRVLRRLADGNLGRVYAPNLENLGARVSRDAERMTGAIASGALVIGGALLAGVGGWHLWLGDTMIVVGLGATLVVALGALIKRSAAR